MALIISPTSEGDLGDNTRQIYNGKFDDLTANIVALDMQDAGLKEGDGLYLTDSANVVSLNKIATGFVLEPYAIQVAGGSFLNMQVISVSGTYTPTSGTVRGLVYATGGGASGAGAGSGVNKSAGSGGGGGGTFVALLNIDDAITGTATIGAGGAGISASAGNVGTNTVLTYDSTTVTGNGGNTGAVGANSSNGEYVLPANETGGSAAGARLVSGHVIFSRVGSPAVYSTTSNTISSGNGGESLYGGGGRLRITNGGSVGTTGDNATGAGSAGGGAIQTNNSNQAGGAGEDGLIVIHEFA